MTVQKGEKMTPPASAFNSPSLSDDDLKNLEDFDHSLRFVKARTNGVALRKHVGSYISGRTGTSKTWTVTTTLDDLGINYQYINCRVSPGGLYDAMKQNPEDVFVLDDVATLYKHPQGLQVLLAALNGTAKEPRQISYVLKGEQKEKTFDFFGGVVAISNKSLHRDPVADAVASRVRILEHEPSDEMIASFMKQQALKGFEDMTPEECWSVVEWIITHSKKCEYRLDLRHMEQGWQDYLLWKDGQSFGVHWKELIASSMNRIVTQDQSLDAPLSKKEELDLQRDKVRQALRMFPNSRDKQITYTRLATRTFDRRLAEVKRAS